MNSYATNFETTCITITTPIKTKDAVNTAAGENSNPPSFSYCEKLFGATIAP